MIELLQKRCFLSVEKELNLVKKYLNEGFIEPLPSGFLKSFLLEDSKFIRSKLAILYLKSQNLEINDDIYKILSAGEIIHSASLLHDDVIDDADTRRGRCSINKKFSPKISILSGDFLLSLAIEKLLELKSFEILKIFKDCTKKMSLAEIEQFFLRDKIPMENEYLDICKNKTACLFSVILQSCAILTNLDLEKARLFGEIFGICFQIKNDLDKDSAEIDDKNGIFTAKKVLGIENTYNLLDNYKKDLNKIIVNFSENIYREELKGLIDSLCSR